MDPEITSLIIVAVVVLLAVATIARARRRWYPEELLLGAVVARLVGSQVRHYVLSEVYRLGDAYEYYRVGLNLAASLNEGSVTLVSPDFWLDSRGWWGTQFVERVSALVLYFVGPSFRSEFFVFSLFSFVGLYAIATAFRRMETDENAIRYTKFIWLWPSLCFWPSSVGKDALITASVGLFTLGCVRNARGVAWGTILGALGLAFCVRPHVAAVLGIVAGVSRWCASTKVWSLRRILEGTLGGIAALVIVVQMSRAFGLASADVDSLASQIEFRSSRTQAGKSQVERLPLSPASTPFAFVNLLARPFPWEAHNFQAVLASAELCVFWGIALRRRNAVRAALADWRRHPFLVLAVPFIAFYGLMLGLTFANLGLLSRQRAILYPFLFGVVFATPRGAPQHAATAPGEDLPHQRVA